MAADRYSALDALFVAIFTEETGLRGSSYSNVDVGLLFKRFNAGDFDDCCTSKTCPFEVNVFCGEFEGDRADFSFPRGESSVFLDDTEDFLITATGSRTCFSLTGEDLENATLACLSIDCNRFLGSFS